MTPRPSDPIRFPGFAVPQLDLSRRRFLKGSAAAALFAPFAPFALTRRADAATKHADVLKVGLIGCGGRGTGAAMQAVSAEEGSVVLTAMADVFGDKIENALGNLKQALGDQFDARVKVAPEHRYTGFDGAAKLIASDVDVVLLATAPHFRPAHLKAAIEAGKHVFCEKPMAVDAPGVRSVMETVAAARAKKLSLVAGFCWRYSVRHREMWKRLHEGAVGKILAFYSTYNATPLGTKKRDPSWSEIDFQLRNWQHFTWLSGDHIAEQAVHSLDKMAWAFKDAPPLSCTAIGGRQARFGEERGDVWDHFGVTFDYADGAKGFHMCRQIDGCSTDNSDWVWGDEGSGFCNGWTPLLKIDGKHAWEYEGDGNDMYQQEHDELFAAIRAGTPINDGDWMTRSTMLAIMARMAAYTGQTITWDQAMHSAEHLGPDHYDAASAPKVVIAIPGKTKFA